MTRRRWIADEVSGDQAALTGDHANHLARVLRARPGQEFDVIAQGVVRSGRVVAVSNERVEFELGPEIAAAQELQITVLLSIFKFDRMEWAIEKCVELGVARIVPVIAQRTETHLAAASSKRLERWRRLALQASEQSRRSSPPQISDILRSEKLAGFSATHKVLLSESESSLSLREALQAIDAKSELALAIGPEGGWANGELDRFKSHSWISATMGSTILRAETAAIAAVAIAAAEMQN